MTGSNEPLAGARAIGVVDAAIGVILAVVGVLVLAGAVAAYGAPVDNPLFDRQLPLVAGAGLAALGVVVAAVGVSLFQETEEGRVGAIAVGVLALATVYLQVHLGWIVLTGTAFTTDLRILFAAAIGVLVYAGPKLAYLTLDEVAERTRRVSRVAPPEARDPSEVGRVLEPEPVEGGETLEPPVVRAEKLSSRGVPEGAVAKTTCTMCGTGLAVATALRPVVVECVECGTHGQLSGRPSAGRPAEPTAARGPAGPGMAERAD